MSRIDVSHIQGLALPGYNFPFPRYTPLHPPDCPTPEQRTAQLIPHITTGERWDAKPKSTVNVAFTHRGLEKLALPEATLLSFPLEFQQGMKARADILGDTGKNGPEKWEPAWHENKVHIWLGVHG